MNDTVYENELQAVALDPRRDLLRSELEETRAAFQHILDTVGIDGWRRKSPSSEWSVGEVLVHLTWALEYLPEEVSSARRGKGMFNLPRRLSDAMSYWYIRWIARTATSGAVLRRYHRAMDAALDLLDKIPEEDWSLGADFYGEGFHSVEDLFHAPARHLAEHTGGLLPVGAEVFAVKWEV